MTRHRRSTFQDGAVARSMTGALNGLLLLIALITIVVPLTVTLATSREELADKPSAHDDRPDLDATPTPRPKPTTSAVPPPPPDGDGGGSAVPPAAVGPQVPQGSPGPASPPSPQLPTMASSGPQQDAPAPVVWTCNSLLGCANQLRAANGVSPLVPSSALDSFAQQCADRVAGTGIYSYSASGPPGTSPWREHITYGYWSEAAVSSALLGSDYHRAAILDPSYTAMGVASSGAWWCQELGG